MWVTVDESTWTVDHTDRPWLTEKGALVVILDDDGEILSAARHGVHPKADIALMVPAAHIAELRQRCRELVASMCVTATDVAKDGTITTVTCMAPSMSTEHTALLEGCKRLAKEWRDLASKRDRDDDIFTALHLRACARQLEALTKGTP